jgi:RHS repeat-associated protein
VYADGAALQPLSRTEYEYEASFNKLVRKRDAEGRETRWAIDATTGDVLTVTDAAGNVTTHAYDADGRLTTTTDARLNVTRYSLFNDFGSPQHITNALSQVTTRVYDLRNRVTREVQQPPGLVSLVTYDGFDRPVRAVRLSGQTWGDEVVESEYHAGGQLRAVTSALGARTESTLDGMNRAIGTSVVVDGEPLTTAMEYDANGNVVRERDRRGIVRVHVYDARNRRESTAIESGLEGEGPTGVIATYGYDVMGRKTHETDVSGLRTDYEYDDLDRVRAKLLPETMPIGFTPVGRLTERFTYDRAGNVLTRTDANGHVTAHEYDALDRVTRVTRDPGGLALVMTTTYCNTPAPTPAGGGALKCEERDLARGLRTSFLYDALGRETTRAVFLEGEDGDPTTGVVTYTTTTAYNDTLHTQTVSGPRPGTQVRIKLDGLVREIERVVDPQDGDGDGQSPRVLTEYDGAGNKTRETDPRGHVTVFTYDGLGRLRAVTDPRQHVTAYAYDGEGLRVSETDRRGVTRRHTYDNLGRARRSALQTAPYSGVSWSRETEYVDANPPKRREKDAQTPPNVTEITLDGLYREVRVTDARGHWTETTWDGAVKRAVRDKRGATTRYAYDALDRVLSVTDPEPFSTQVETTAYDDASNRVTVTDRRGAVQVTQSDPLGRVRTVTRAGVVQEKNTYDEAGNKTLGEDGSGRRTAFEYDRAGRLVRRIDGYGSPEAGATAFMYDASSNKVKEVDGRASESEPSGEWAYDELNRVTDEWDGERNRTRLAYDEEGNRTRRTEPLGQVTAFAWDELGKLLSVTQPTTEAGTAVTTYKYDRNRNLIEQCDARGHVVVMEYDELNRLKKREQPGAVITTYQYDANGNDTERVDPKGQKTTTTYDELNRETLREYALAVGASAPVSFGRTASIAREYDANGNLTEVSQVLVDAQGGSATRVATLTYDDLDRLTSEAVPTATGTATVAYEYHANGTRSRVTDSVGGVTAYEYDGRNRLKEVRTGYGTANEALTTYAYWPDDLLKEVISPNGVKASSTYDQADRLTLLTNAKGAALVSSYAYTYDANGNRVQQVELNGGVSETTGYAYDEVDRLKTVTYPADAAYATGRTITYGYDLVGNRVRETERDGGAAMLSDKVAVFDALNRLQTVTDAVVPANDAAFVWDANGNPVSKTVGGVVTEYAYDTLDKLLEVRSGATTLARFQYDYAGRRTQKVGADGAVQYVHDGTAVLEELDATTGGVRAKYEWGSDRLISLFRTSEPRRYYSFDGLGSVVGLTDVSGASVASYHLDAWGNYRFPAELSVSANRFGFTGHEWDAETKLYYAKARYFDPQLGRFLTQDSYLGEIDDPPSLHRYFYANANPAKYVDSTGHFAHILAGAGFGALFGAGLNIARQTVAIAEGAQDGFEWGQLAKATAGGAVAGGLIIAAPWLATPLAFGGGALALHSAVAEWDQGHRGTAIFDTFTTIALPFAVRGIARLGKGAGKSGAPDAPDPLSIGEAPTGAKPVLKPAVGEPTSATPKATAKVDAPRQLPAGREARQLSPGEPASTSSSPAATRAGNREPSAPAARASAEDPIVTRAKTEADSAQAATPRPGAAGALEVDGEFFTARSARGHEPQLHARVRQALDDVPLPQQSRSHGRCVEVQCLSKVLETGRQPAGGRSHVRTVRPPGNPRHNQELRPCSTCAIVLRQFGVTPVSE